MNKQLALLNNLEGNVEKENNVSAYYYLSEPDYPVVKDKPKKALILAIGFILGTLLSSVFFSFRWLVRK